MMSTGSGVRWHNEELLAEVVGHSDPLPRGVASVSPTGNDAESSGFTRQRTRLMRALDEGDGRWRNENDFAVSADFAAVGARRGSIASTASIELMQRPASSHSVGNEDDFEQMRRHTTMDGVFFTDFADLLLDRDGCHVPSDRMLHAPITERNMRRHEAAQRRSVSTPVTPMSGRHRTGGRWLCDFTRAARAVPVQELARAIVGAQPVYVDGVAENIAAFLGVSDEVESSRRVASRNSTACS